ncbi:MAG: TerB family tellurite resistance protein [Rhodospirillales bacterium]
MAEGSRQMILDVLTGQQKLVFSKMASKLVLADWRVPDAEDDFVMKLRAHLELDNDPPKGAVFEEIDFGVFDSKKARNAAMVLLFLISYADGHYHSAEAELLESWAASMGISPQETERMRNWAERHIDQMREVMDLLRD